MASVYRRPKSKYWFAGWYDSNGKFHLRSTKQTDRKNALTFALNLERAEKLARQRLLTETAARNVLNEILERTGATQRLRMPSAKEWLDDWLRDKEANTSPDTADRYRSVCKAFIAHLGERASHPLAAVSAHDVQSYTTTFRKKGAGFKTVDLHLATIRGAFNKARRLGLIESNPAEAVEIAAKDGEEFERETFSPAEVALLVKAAEGEWKTLILLGYYTGARLTTCAMLDWQSVDLVNGKISFRRPGKRGKPVEVPLHPELSADLEARASQDTEEEKVLPLLAGKDAGGKRGLSRAFKQLARDAGVDLREVTNAAGRKFCKRSFHALRHSFTSALANADVSPELRRKLTGHKTATAHDVYTHHEMEVLRSAIGKLPNLPPVSNPS